MNDATTNQHHHDDDTLRIVRPAILSDEQWRETRDHIQGLIDNAASEEGAQRDDWDRPSCSRNSWCTLDDTDRGPGSEHAEYCVSNPIELYGSTDRVPEHQEPYCYGYLCQDADSEIIRVELGGRLSTADMRERYFAVEVGKLAELLTVLGHAGAADGLAALLAKAAAL